MGKLKALIFFSLFLFFIIDSAQAGYIMSCCNSTGYEKEVFYVNDTIRVRSAGNITTNAMVVVGYVVMDMNYYWYEGINITNIAVSRKLLAINSSGYLPDTIIMMPPIPQGNYDIMLDMNGDGAYNYSIDYVDNITKTGFTVVVPIRPMLNATVGYGSPQNHDWNLSENGSSDDMMLQMNLTSTSRVSYNITGVYIKASGTGNDEYDIRSAMVVWDSNNNGKFDNTENILSIGKFPKDDDYLFFDFKNSGVILYANYSTNLLFFYSMNSSGNITGNHTYSFQVIQILVEDINRGKDIVVYGLPISSAQKTLIAPVLNISQPEKGENINISLPPETVSQNPAGGETGQESGISLKLLIYVAIAIAAVCAGLYLFLRKKS